MVRKEKRSYGVEESSDERRREAAKQPIKMFTVSRDHTIVTNVPFNSLDNLVETNNHKKKHSITEYLFTSYTAGYGELRPLRLNL